MANRILVRGVNWVGDTILSYPAVQQLKAVFPGSRLAVLVPDHLADLWKTFPYVDEIIPFHKKRGLSSIQEDLSLSLTFKKKRFDLAVIFPRSFHSAFPIFLARIPIRIGYGSGVRSLLLTRRLPRTEEVLHIHRVGYYMKLVESLQRPGGCPSPRIFLREEDRAWANQTLKGSGLHDGMSLIAMNPGATYGQAKCWPPERFGELGKRFSKRWKAAVLLFGKEEERGASREILRHLEGAGVDFTGRTGLLQLAALLERCQFLVTNDTGTMHVGAAVGTPVVALFGPTDPAATGPRGDEHIIVKKEVSCGPCFKRICPADHRCMRGITVDDVEEVIAARFKDQTVKGAAVKVL